MSTERESERLSTEESDQMERSNKKVKMIESGDGTNGGLANGFTAIKQGSGQNAVSQQGLVSFRDKLLKKTPTDGALDDVEFEDPSDESDESSGTEESDSDSDGDERVTCPELDVSQEEYDLWCRPWQLTLLVKLMGKTMGVNFIVGNLIGKKLKVDPATSIKTRGKFARICVEINLKRSLVLRVKIRGRTFEVEYEGLHLVCFHCGKSMQVSTSNTTRYVCFCGRKVLEMQ
ncbi:hypothetical protein G2W53_008122 [Senna tora]|uniref:Uncharacterized protein n=1 Tax=Senna tora TaxID=362788 RepID=A0A835CGN2_9FABA|nr:hypothetical protein G2W53_008122 [Senna tora]